MSLKIRLELQDDDHIFSPSPMSYDDVKELVIRALNQSNPIQLSGPTREGHTQVYVLTAPDPRTKFVAGKPTEREHSSDFD